MLPWAFCLTVSCSCCWIAFVNSSTWCRALKSVGSASINADCLRDIAECCATKRCERIETLIITKGGHHLALTVSVDRTPKELLKHEVLLGKKLYQTPDCFAYGGYFEARITPAPQWKRITVRLMKDKANYVTYVQFLKKYQNKTEAVDFQDYVNKKWSSSDMELWGKVPEGSSLDIFPFYENKMFTLKVEASLEDLKFYIDSVLYAIFRTEIPPSETNFIRILAAEDDAATLHQLTLLR